MRSLKATAPAAFKDSRPGLCELRGIGPAMLNDFELLGVRTVEQLATRDATELYEGLNHLTGTRQDPCVLDTFRCAIEQARNPGLPAEQKNWWYWSRRRKAS